jgi:imidazolonepropionase-like amidohydrolase
LSKLFALTLAAQFACHSYRSADDFIHTRAQAVALSRVTVIDGTGAPARRDQTLVIESGRIKEVGDSGGTRVPPGALVLDLPGYTIIPGMVGMHEHLFYAVNGGDGYITAGAPFARLYLACGVTTVRTGGTLDLQGDLKLKEAIDAGREPGPRVFVTSPYLNGHGDKADPERAARDVEAWAGQGATSVKAYTGLKRTELSAAVEAAHRRGLKVTGHLCAVGFREAAASGIDNLEHGLLVDTEFFPRKEPDVCPNFNENVAELTRLDVDGAPVRQTIRELVERRVAVTSTLAIFESFAPQRFSLDPRVESVLTPELYAGCRSELARRSKTDWRNASEMWAAALKKEMQFERSFAKAGGTLLAGADPTGWGGVLAGFGDQRNLELLVEAGFTPEEAVRISSANGAEFLGVADRVGTLTAGKQADLAVIRGDLAADIRNIRNVEIVFKEGLGYDSAKLTASVRGAVGAGETRWAIIAAWALAAAALGFLVLRRLLRRVTRRPRQQ